MADYPFENTIAYEDRAKIFTHDWRLAGVNTLAAGNTNLGKLFYNLTKVSTTYTVNVFKDGAEGSSDKVASGSVVSSTSPSDENPLSITLAEANSSGLTGALKIAQYNSDENDGVLWVLFCVDSDIEKYYDGYDQLNLYSSTAGMAGQIDVATFKIIDRLTALYDNAWGGVGKSPWWQQGDKRYPRLDRILNPTQLREAAVYYTLFMSTNASANTPDEAYWDTAQKFKDLYEEAIGSIRVAIDADSDGDGDAYTSVGISKWQRA